MNCKYCEQNEPHIHFYYTLYKRKWKTFEECYIDIKSELKKYVKNTDMFDLMHFSPHLVSILNKANQVPESYINDIAEKEFNDDKKCDFNINTVRCTNINDVKCEIENDESFVRWFN